MSDPEFLGEPQTERERQLGKDHAIYGNVFTGNTYDAIDLLSRSLRPGRESNPLPEDQRVICGNLFNGYSHDAPGKSCLSDIVSGDGVGHLGGDSPWNGDNPTKGDVFSRHAMAKHLDVMVEANSVPTDTAVEAKITLTNEGDSHEEVVLRFRIREHVLTTETVSVPAGETRVVHLTEGGLPNPKEVSITRNGQSIGFVRVTDDG